MRETPLKKDEWEALTISQLSHLPPPMLAQLLSEAPNEWKQARRWDWNFWRREKQTEPPGSWTTWLILAGRGWGKTRVGAEWVRQRVQTMPIVNLIGATVDDCRDIQIYGESGILEICPPDERPVYRKSERRLLWPNGAYSLVFTADEPERLRGKQHMSFWADEVGAWRHDEAFEQALLGLRIGPDPRAIVTTTPKPRKLILELMASPSTVVTRGTTYENVGNLHPKFFTQVISRFEGTRLGRQELMAQLLMDNPGALWKRARIDELRVSTIPRLRRVVIAVDPEAGSGPDSSETGIIAAGVGEDGHGYVLDDVSLRGSPDEWAKRAWYTFKKHKANLVVAEVNNGGDMVIYTMRTVAPHIPVEAIHASRGKYTRAEPVAALYEQGRVHHHGFFGALEDQLVQWTPGDTSPDRLDALVWALTKLFDLDVPEPALDGMGYVYSRRVPGWNPR